MKLISIRIILPLFLFFLITFQISLHAAVGRRAMVVTSDPRATAAALKILEQGGNAIEAAIAAQWVLNVVEPQSSGLGGGGFLLYYDALRKQIHAFDGREKAPADVFPEMFYDEDGVLYPFYPYRITGGLSVGVPGTLKLLQEVHNRFRSRKFSFARLFDPAIELAEQGVPVSKRLARHIKKHQDRLMLFPASQKVFFNEEGRALKEGTIFFQPDLAETFRLIQRKGTQVFYEGEIATDIVRAIREAPFLPGLMSEEDLFYYTVRERNSVRSRYRGYDIFSVGPPSSGGTTLIETLNILEFFDLSQFGRTAEGIHLFNEAQKIAFRDRNKMIGDPGFVEVPTERLLSKEFAQERSQGIRWDAEITTTKTDVSPLNPGGHHTAHISVVDDDGNMVAFTTTIESVFGSALMVPGRGFFLNNELTDFDVVPKDEEGKLVPNAPEGEKRPRSSMTPTFVFREGKPLLIAGASGDSRIIGAVLNVIVNLLDFDMSLEGAVLEPRIINRDGPMELERQLYGNDVLRRDLEKLGHPIRSEPSMGIVQAIYFDHEEGFIYGESDWRGDGNAMGY